MLERGGVMRQLPGIFCSNRVLRFPLCDATSLALETALLAPDAEQCLDVLLESLTSDPAFFLWAVCGAWSIERAEAVTPEGAARWLAPRLLDRLADLTSANAGDEPNPSADEAWAAPAGVRWHLGSAPRWLAAAAGCDSLEDAAELVPPALAKRIDEACQQEDDSELLDAAERFARQDHGTRRRLPELVAKLLRLRQLETQFAETLQREKIESLRQLAYGAGHEINNPLANISARAQTLLKQEHDPERRRALAAINSQAFRAHEMIADLMLFSRPPKLVPAEVDLVELADAVLGELEHDADLREIELQRTGDTQPVPAEADRVQLGVALRAMCVNSLEAIGRCGKIELEIRPGSTSAQVIVSDTGPGIGEEVRRHLFDPFYSGREAGRGLGFGLSKCWRIVTDHGGEILVDSPVGGGAVFTISLPITYSDPE